MTDARDAGLPRPAPAAAPGRSTTRFYDLVEARFRRLVRDNPILATFLGLHDRDDELGDGGRDAVLERARRRARAPAAIEALDPAGLSPTARFERDLELHNVRRAIFDTDVLRIWERRSTALDTIGDGLFLLFARDHAPLAERLERDHRPARGRADLPRGSADPRDGPQVRRWQRIELETPPSCRPSSTRSSPAADGVLGRPSSAPRCARRTAPRSRSSCTADVARGQPRRRHRRLGDRPRAPRRARRPRAFDGLDADAILELGWEQLARARRRAVAAAREIDPDAAEAEVVDRIKSDHPADFEAALDAYRDAMRPRPRAPASTTTS